MHRRCIRRRFSDLTTNANEFSYLFEIRRGADDIYPTHKKGKGCTKRPIVTVKVRLFANIIYIGSVLL